MATSDLTTVQSVKDWLKLTTADDDGLIQRLVTAISTFVSNQTGRTFQPTTYTLTLDGWGGSKYMFPNRPVTAVASVSIGGSVLQPSQYVWDSLTLRLKCGCFYQGVGNVVITFTAGYASIPADLDDAVAEVCSWAYKERDRIGIAENPDFHRND